MNSRIKLHEDQDTLILIKPDGMRRGLTGLILDRFLKAGMRLRGSKILRLTHDEAAGFYKVHEKKSFYSDLISFMTSGPVAVFVLRGERAVERVRSVMGKTDPAEAHPGTVRHDFGVSRSYNTVHGPDSIENAEREIPFFFKETDLLPLESMLNISDWYSEGD